MSSTTPLTSLEKGLRILKELAAGERGITAAELAQATDLNRTTAYRLCEILQRAGWVQRFGDGGEGEVVRLDLGPTFHGVAVLVTSKYETESKLRPILANLSRTLSETVHLAVLERAHVVHIASETPQAGLHVAAGLGSRAHAHASALGKALLATASDEEVRSYYDGEVLPVFTPTTIASVSALLAELRRVRDCGYSLDDQESNVGIKCVAVPIFGGSGEPVFAMSVTTVPQRLEGDSLTEAVGALKGAASLATASFGGVVPETWR